MNPDKMESPDFDAEPTLHYPECPNEGSDDYCALCVQETNQIHADFKAARYELEMGN